MKAAVIAVTRDQRASSAAEFALVLPVLLIFLFGIIDVGRLMWTWNRAEMATQMGVRYAVATDPVANGLTTYSFATGANIPQGAAIDESYFSSMSCDSTTCGSCVGSACSSLETPYNSTAFANIVDRMRAFLPELAANNVIVQYSYSGLGYSGDPNGSDISPVVTVKIRNLTFQPITFTLFKSSIHLPSFSAALTMEDGQGTAAN